MALVYLLFVLDRPKVKLLIIHIYDSEDYVHRLLSEDSVHSLLALDRFLFPISAPPGQVRPVQELD